MGRSRTSALFEHVQKVGMIWTDSMAVGFLSFIQVELLQRIGVGHERA